MLSSLAPAFVGGVPGGPEVIVLLMIAVLFGIPLVAVLVIAYFLVTRSGSSADDRVAELEREVAVLEREVEELRSEVSDDHTDRD